MGEKRPNRKSTNADIQLRVQVVYGWLTEGHSRSTIIRKVAEETKWNLCDRQVENYIAKARVLLEEDCAMSRQAFLAETLGNLRRLQAAAEKKGNQQTALGCLRLASELAGLNK